jgi:hypothetical protein
METGHSFTRAHHEEEHDKMMTKKLTKGADIRALAHELTMGRIRQSFLWSTLSGKLYQR